MLLDTDKNFSTEFCEPWPKCQFPKIRGTILGVPMSRLIIFWGLYWGPPI